MASQRPFLSQICSLILQYTLTDHAQNVQIANLHKSGFYKIWKNDYSWISKLIGHTHWFNLLVYCYQTMYRNSAIHTFLLHVLQWVKRIKWGLNMGVSSEPCRLSPFMSSNVIWFRWSQIQQSTKQSTLDPLFFIFLRMWKINV